ncbi:succinylornithine transaminase (ACOAT) [Clostridioides difficile]|uniref:Acetylornithine aminotransferase n=3 Tax=Clostridioides difficile TaxID=1496 RepID=A0A9R0BKZ4_CLODR|nr:aspartate aminotransferase family protein [Clostridioides difficile]OFT99751.1 acetylornithine aminotransferase [Clostridium sp. HMSC19E03]OFU14580.1 acetylornithine aminotransferase [Clostridium sp. HMSC19C09]OFU18746.1 acetylornithine aminotransferase [Clostridium sp. HMSC19C08]OFU19999.1 acetylornithine aminotransferase [Clostridium sp. HMSC19C05]OFU29424.1 acetylornithine aminotransferase [Clostridium sp. HMSC19B10]OFU29757.1 acetylornithine aminotransferase [Clostridium sp. HMSC19B11]
MNNNNTISKWNEYFIDTYNQPNFVIDYGEGSCFFDTNGNKYIDFTSGYGVSSLGYSNSNLKNALKEQVDKLLHTSNLYFNEPVLYSGEKIINSSGMAKVYFCNSGTEANETAFKIARKYSSDKYGNGRGTIISLKDSFHGRTMMSLMATGMDKYHKYFYPLPEGFKYIERNNIEDLKNNLDSTVCAIILEAIQGEGGVNVLEKDYVLEIVKICQEKDIVVIFDEVQCGIGRTGKLFGYEYFDVKPDIVTVAKGLGAGIPVGGVLVNKKLSKVLGKGDQGTTFGGNLLAMVAASVVLDEISKDGFYNEVLEKGNYIRKSIESFNNKVVLKTKGIGLMIGIETNIESSIIEEKARKKGLLILTAGKNVLRFLPPLTISYKEIDEALEILKDILLEIN